MFTQPIRRRALLLLILAALMWPAHAQDGFGVVREGTTLPLERVGESQTTVYEFNPLLCTNDTCARLNDLIAPRLLYTDPRTARVERAPSGSNALVASWLQSVDARTVTFTLRDDLTWDDGTPVTAYDALFSLSAVLAPTSLTRFNRFNTIANAEGIAAPDARTLVVRLQAPTCEVFNLVDVPLVAAHAFDPGFRELAEAATTGEDTAEQVAGWQAAAEEYDFGVIFRHPYSLEPPHTNESAYTLADVRPAEYLRLISPDGKRAYEVVAVDSTASQIDRFLQGDLNLIHDLPYQRAPDVIAAGGTVRAVSSGVAYALAFNFADPKAPRPFDTDDEDGQGIHPIWSDERVRQAAALALTPEPIIDAVALGYGDRIASIAPPGAWYANERLSVPVSNQNEARRLLTEAGWRDTGGGVRVCVTCDTAEPGTQLSLTLDLLSDPTETELIVLRLLTEQLNQVGFGMEGFNPITSIQSIDAHLIAVDTEYPYNPVRAFSRFETTQDIPNEGRNSTSYSNPRVDNLLQDARNLRNCGDEPLSAAYYQDAAALLAQDTAFVPLFSPQTLTAVGPGVSGFAPLPGAPAHNIASWIITEGTS